MFLNYIKCYRIIILDDLKMINNILLPGESAARFFSVKFASVI